MLIRRVFNIVLGIEYDSDGNKIKWPTEIKEAYDNRAKCFVNQFNDLNNFNKSIEEDSPEVKFEFKTKHK